MGGVTVSLNKRGRWDLLKNLKAVKTQQKGSPRDKVPQYHDMAKGSCQCSGYYPDPKPRDNRPAFLHKIRTALHHQPPLHDGHTSVIVDTTTRHNTRAEHGGA